MRNDFFHWLLHLMKFDQQYTLLVKSVEMPGIEPGSERFDPRKSTSVACRISSPQTPRRAGKPVTICLSFACLAESHAALHHCFARSVTG
jgi:hypothetical protein